MAYNTIVFFGDSLTDNGNLSEVVSSTGEVLPPSPYVDGVFSNGLVHSDILPELLGVESLNYALASGRAVGSRPVNEFLDGYGVPTPTDIDGYDINLNAQVDRFLDDNNGADLGDTAAAVLIGANDLNGIEFATDPLIAILQLGQAITQIAEGVLEAAEELAEAGLGTLIYYTLPGASFFPAFTAVDPTLQLVADDVIDAVNDRVLTELGESDVMQDVELEVVDLNRLAQEVADNRESFGFVADQYTAPVSFNELDPLTPNFDLGDYDEDQYMFWDILHPTTALHSIIAAFTDASLSMTERFMGGGVNIKTFGAKDDFVLAGGGNDVVSGGDGSDIVFGGLGDDTLGGGDKADIVFGGDGNDRLRGDGGGDIVVGGIGDDILRGNEGADLLVGGGGDDRVYGGLGDDTLVFVDPALTDGVASSDFYDGNNGEDTLYVVLDADAFIAVSGAQDQIAALEAELGLVVQNVENIILLESRDDLGTEISALGYEEAELWGFV